MENDGNPVGPIRSAFAHGMLKTTSARWICTVGAIGIWAYLAWNGDLSPEFHGTMIALVIKSYFDRREAE